MLAPVHFLPPEVFPPEDIRLRSVRGLRGDAGEDPSAVADENGPVPLFFGTGQVTCFGFYHPAQATPRSTGVVLCLPVGYEGTCAFETFTALAEKLSASGFDVLRFDYHGTGDSPGRDADRDRVGAWRASIGAAVDELRRVSRCRSVSAVGLRIGATLAAEVAGGGLALDSLVMWAPCASGRAFTRELKVAAASHVANAASQAASEETQSGDLEALGFLYTGETIAQLARMDLLKLDAAPAPRVLLIGRDAYSSEGALGARLRSRTDLTFVARDGLAQVMRDSHERVVPHALVDEITDWMSRQHPVVPVRPAARDVAPTLHAIEFDGVRETPLRFGEQGHLFGILTEPTQEVEPRSAAAKTAILMLNVGTNHRVGPNRLYVKMARCWAKTGYHCLRFDLAGMGDSRAASGYAATRLYSKDSVTDVRAAMDALVERGCERFVLLGLCSGAYAAFQATLADSRVVAQVLLNPRRLNFSAGDTLERVMSESYKSSRYYQKALLSPQTYLRFVRGEVNVRGIGHRMQALMAARVRRLCNRALGRPPAEEDVLSNVKLLCRRGVESLFVVGAEDDGLDYLEFHLGARGRAVRSPRFHMELVHGSDHTFSRGKSQDALLSFVSAQLEQRLRRELPERPHTTTVHSAP